MPTALLSQRWPKNFILSEPNTSDKLTGLAASRLLSKLGVDARTLSRSLLSPPGLVCFIGLLGGLKPCQWQTSHKAVGYGPGSSSDGQMFSCTENVASMEPGHVTALRLAEVRTEVRTFRLYIFGAAGGLTLHVRSRRIALRTGMSLIPRPIAKADPRLDGSSQSEVSATQG